MAKTLLLHAGTHKTASSYIKGSLLSNKRILESLSVKLLDLGKVDGEKILPRIISSRDKHLLDNFLNCDNHDFQNLIYSAEQCTQKLIEKKDLEWFLDALDDIGIKLRLAIFLRDQPDYINSTYIQGVKKFRHAMPISEYIEKCFSEWYWFDYDRMFASVINESRLHFDFLPYGRQFGDPFERLMALPGWLPHYKGAWLPSSKKFTNEQPGVKGVYLALLVFRRLNALGANTNLLKKRAQYINKLIKPKEWGKERFFGLDELQVETIKKFYSFSNNQFSKKVWSNPSWKSVFIGEKTQKLSILHESDLTLDERNEIHLLAGKVIKCLKRASPESFPGNS